METNCEVWTHTGKLRTVFMTACIQPADSSLKLRLENIPWKLEQ